MATLPEAMKYPFLGGAKYFYFLIGLIPIYGWLAYPGYLIKVLQNVIHSKKEIPEWGDWWQNFVIGLQILLIGFTWGICLAICTSIVGLIPIIGAVLSIIIGIVGGLVIMVLFLQFAVHLKLEDAFDIKRAASFTKKNMGELIIAYLFSIAVALVFGFFPIIIGLIGLMLLGGYGVGLDNIALLAFGLSFVLLSFVGLLALNPAIKIASYKLFGDVYKKVK